MRRDDVFPSKWIKASDLQGRQVTVTIDRLEMETIGDETKPVLYFIGKEKGMVLNQTNWGSIEPIAGEDTDQWHNQKVVLFPTKVQFNGKMVDAIRIMPPATQSAPARRPVPQSKPVAPSPVEPSQEEVDARAAADDNIPF